MYLCKKILIRLLINLNDFLDQSTIVSSQETNLLFMELVFYFSTEMALRSSQNQHQREIIRLAYLKHPGTSP